MICGECGTRLKVIDSREWKGEVVRQRYCPKCKTDFYTLEVVIGYKEGQKMRDSAVLAKHNVRMRGEQDG